MAILVLAFAAACKKDEPAEAPEPAKPEDAGRKDVTALLLEDASVARPDVGPRPTPDLGGHDGRLVAGWEGLSPLSRSADVRRSRPKARSSDVSGLVMTETLQEPWLAATYRFDRVDGALREVRWIADDETTGLGVFTALVTQGMSRWQAVPDTTLKDGRRVARWKTPDGDIRLSMEEATGRIGLEWSPPAPRRRAVVVPQALPTLGRDSTP